MNKISQDKNNEYIKLRQAYDHACTLGFEKIESFDVYKATMDKRIKRLEEKEEDFLFDQLIDLTKALSNELRLKLLIFVSLSIETCFCELTNLFDVEQSTLTYHLAFLSRANLIKTKKKGKWKIISTSKNFKKLLPSKFLPLFEQ